MKWLCNGRGEIIRSCQNPSADEDKKLEEAFKTLKSFLSTNLLLIKGRAD